MEYITRHLTSDPGLDQREALTALQTDPTFKPGSIVAGIRRRNERWAAEVLEPKTAEFPPTDEGGDEGGGDDSPAPEPKKDDGPPSDSGGEGPPSPEGEEGPPKDDKGGKPESKGSTEDMILHTLTQILHALQGGGAPDVLGGPDALGPGGPPGGPGAPPKAPGGPPGAGGPPMGGKGPMKGPPPMKPGMTPPGGTPIGAPAFASTQHQAVPGAPVPTGVEPGPVGQQAGAGVCPQDGNPEPCPVHSGQGGQGGGLPGMVASYSGRAATITLTREGTDIKAAVEEARPVVENYGYTVKQAKHSDDGTQIHILASRR